MEQLTQWIEYFETALTRQDVQHLTQVGGLLDKVTIDLHQAFIVQGLVQGHEARLQRLEEGMRTALEGSSSSGSS